MEEKFEDRLIKMIDYLHSMRIDEFTILRNSQFGMDLQNHMVTMMSDASISYHHDFQGDSKLIKYKGFTFNLI